METFMKRKLAILVTIVLAIFCLISCSPKEKPVLRIGMNVEFPPFGSVVDSAYVGVDVDIAAKIAENLELPYEIINLEFDSLIHALISEKIDIIISAMSITEERSRQVEFSRPYYLAHQVLIAAESSPPMPKDESELGMYKLGVLHGSTAHKHLKDNYIDKDLLSQDSLSLYVSNTEAIDDLIRGNVDFVVNDNSAAYGFSRQYPVTIGLQLSTVEEYAIAMPRNGKYNEDVNKALKDLIDSGEIASILATHIQ